MLPVTCSVAALLPVTCSVAALYLVLVILQVLLQVTAACEVFGFEQGMLVLQVVGVVLLQPLTDLSQLHHKFETTKVPGLGPLRATDQHVMQLTHFCLNPIFAQQAEAILLQILKRCKSNLLLYLLGPGQPPPDVLKTFR